MSLIESCIEIGHEIQKTMQGQKALEIMRSLFRVDVTYDIDFFMQVVERYHHKFCFNAPDVALQIIAQNIENPTLGYISKKIVSNEAVLQFAVAMKSLGEITEGITTIALRPEVKYSLPSGINVSSKVIRLLHEMAMHYQRTQLTKEILLFRAKDNELLQRIIREFDEYEERNCSEKSAYIAGDFKMIDAMIQKGYPENKVLILYKIVSTIKYMKLAIYYGFFDVILVLSERNDNEIIITDSFEKYGYNHIVFDSNIWKPSGVPHGEWMFKLIDLSGNNKYYQILSKRFEMASQKDDSRAGFTIKAVCLDGL